MGGGSFTSITFFFGFYQYLNSLLNTGSSKIILSVPIYLNVLGTVLSQATFIYLHHCQEYTFERNFDLLLDFL